MELDVPKEDKGYKITHEHVTLAPMDHRLIHQFTNTYSGMLFDVEYELRCVIKHDCWNEWGEGYKISLPIKILAAPEKVAHDNANESFEMPKSW